ncbi:DUF58 domain-containing protein [Tahibacter amnicola]|uniref:DUF58 domain-containing protein n=1 Tax=Tahibacter amnicola TaxID=2976241 RepID=A0ABY6BDC8_9GAMM|nr:DUF58 domain-containing protein [Tahibacter amnicola]UXI68029.1 DUF58 domain-containing protein [Tahibacter amnicola]
MRPSAGLVGGLVACALASGLALAGWAPWTFVLILAGVLVLLAVQDALRLRGLPTPSVERDIPPIIPVGVERRVVLRLRHSARQVLQLDVHDLHPSQWAVFGLPRRVGLPPAREMELPYRLTPDERGIATFEGCAVRLRSPLGLWWQQRRVPLRQSVRVYPNFAPLAKLALVGAEQASRVIGAHLKRRRGEGTEFQQLREYRTGDSMRQIDWKASQRARKLISRDYQEEKNQQVMLLLDTGRRMLSRDDGLAHFDHVLNAALMVAYIALRQGDAVGLLASGGPSRFMAPRRGMGAIDAMLNTVFDLQPEAVATDYLEAATRLGTRQSRRCLVLLITNARDEDMDDLVAAVRLLQRRHLVCVASLREGIVDEIGSQPVNDLEDAIAIGAMSHYAEQRTQAHRNLRAQGADVLDVNCRELPRTLVEHYLAIKRAARL